MAVLLCSVWVVRRIGVDQRRGEVGDGVDEIVFGVVGNAVRVSQAQGWIDVEFGVGVQAVADPAHPQAAN